MHDEETRPEPTRPARPFDATVALIDDAWKHRLREDYGEVSGQLVELFRKGAEASLEELRIAASRADVAGQRHAAHQLKGSCQSIGATFMADLAERLERGAEPMVGVEELEAAFSLTHEALKLALLRPAR